MADGLNDLENLIYNNLPPEDRTKFMQERYPDLDGNAARRAQNGGVNGADPSRITIGPNGNISIDANAPHRDTNTTEPSIATIGPDGKITITPTNIGGNTTEPSIATIGPDGKITITPTNVNTRGGPNNPDDHITFPGGGTVTIGTGPNNITISTDPDHIAHLPQEPERAEFPRAQHENPAIQTKYPDGHHINLGPDGNITLLDPNGATRGRTGGTVDYTVDIGKDGTIKVEHNSDTVNRMAGPDEHGAANYFGKTFTSREEAAIKAAGVTLEIAGPDEHGAANYFGKTFTSREEAAIKAAGVTLEDAGNNLRKYTQGGGYHAPNGTSPHAAESTLTNAPLEVKQAQQDAQAKNDRGYEK